MLIVTLGGVGLEQAAAQGTSTPVPSTASSTLDASGPTASTAGETTTATTASSDGSDGTTASPTSATGGFSAPSSSTGPSSAVNVEEGTATSAASSTTSTAQPAAPATAAHAHAEDGEAETDASGAAEAGIEPDHTDTADEERPAAKAAPTTVPTTTGNTQSSVVMAVAPTAAADAQGSHHRLVVRLVSAALATVGLLIALLTWRFWWYTDPRRGYVRSRAVLSRDAWLASATSTSPQRSDANGSVASEDTSAEAEAARRPS